MASFGLDKGPYIENNDWITERIEENYLKISKNNDLN